MTPLPEHQWTVREVQQWACHQLAAAQCASPEAEARHIIMAAGNYHATDLVLVGREPASPMLVERVRDIVQQRQSRRPLQHILGTAPFLDFSVRVGEGVFIPRPETELMAQWAGSALDQYGAEWRQHTRATDSLTIVDLCSGSGVLALALARQVPTARVWAVEYSPSALPFLEANVRDNAPQVSVVEGDVRLPLTQWGLDPASVDMVVCNPPYVPEGSEVDVETAIGDPADAVFSGSSGVELTAAILEHLPMVLRPGALVAFEHDDTTGEDVRQLLCHAGFEQCHDHTDLAGRPRFCTARWRPQVTGRGTEVGDEGSGA